MEDSDKIIPVRVALRIRPFVSKEIEEGCLHCIEAIPNNPQVVVKGSSEGFTFDYVFDGQSQQKGIYSTAVASLIEQIFKGYNVTILAYGQTGSGKTFTMGTADFSYTDVQDSSGIIPRAIKDIFDGISKREDSEFLVKVSFLELYKEQLFDLLSSKSRAEAIIEIREDAKGIKLPGLSEVPVSSPAEALSCLESGSRGRQIGATAMNDKSSRSHAVFTLTVEQKKNNVVFMSSRFHLVDLAGSERVAKTKATGNRFQEGIKINAGLLALGNVICKLGAGDSKHINYRDSKLTRLLQDSLGGNSFTLMIACVGPADYNLDETLSTIRYADRARKIKNKPIKNQDPAQVELEALRKQVRTLEYQLEQSGGVTATYANSVEITQLREKNRILEEENANLSAALQSAVDQSTVNEEKLMHLESANAMLRKRICELENMANATFDVIDVTKEENQSLLKHIDEVKAHISLIQREQDTCDEELLQLDISLSRAAVNVSVHPQTENLKLEAMTEESSDDESEGGRNEQEEEYKLEMNKNVLDRAKMSREINTLQRDILEKQGMVRKLTQCVTLQVDTVHVRTLEDQVNKLQKEREDLIKQLETVQSNTASNKVAEQRRKRVEELEHQIGDLKKKITEQTKALNQKKKIESEVAKLNSHIQDLKCTRVKLIRQMREDGEKFRLWKKQKDHEIMQLREHERKREGERIRKDRLHSKQQLVMKRRLEDAIANSKRLKEAVERMERSKVTPTSRSDKNQPQRTPAVRAEEQMEKIRSLVDREINLVCSLKQAQRSSKVLSEQRKELAKEISSLKQQIATAKSDELARLRESLKIAEGDLEIRSGQILELQKLAAMDLDSKGKNRWDNLTTMQDMKAALSALFEGFVESKVEASVKESELNDLRAEIVELQAQYEKALSAVENHVRAVKQVEAKHEEELKQRQREYEEKVLNLITQMTANDATTSTIQGDDQQRLQFQETELLKMKSLEAELVEKRNEIEQLQSELKHFKESRPNSSAETSTQRKKVKVNEKGATPRYTVAEFFNSSQEEIETESEEDDPEWRKTPMYKRVKALTSKFRGSDTTLDSNLKFDSSGQNEESEEPKPKAKKRASISNCRCVTGSCSGCICVKDRRCCDERCKCTLSKKCGNVHGNSVLDKENHGITATAEDGIDNTDDVPEELKPKKRRTRD